MGRPRTPSNVLELRGSFKKDPQRQRPDEPKAKDGVGDAPDYFDGEQRAAWDEIVANCADGVFQSSDRHAVEYTAKLIAEMRTNPRFSTERGKTLVQLLSRFGMTPSDRSRVMVQNGKKRNPFSGLL